MTDDDLRALFREMRDEPIPPGSLARVRAGIVARDVPRRWVYRLAVPFAILLAACLWLTLRVPTPQALERPVMNLPANVRHPPLVPLVQPVTRPPAVRRPVLRSALKVMPNRLPVTIRIETPDPEVVILLIGN